MMYRFSIFDRFPELKQGMSTRILGSLNDQDSAFEATLCAFQAQLGIAERPRFLNQVHGDAIWVAEGRDRSRPVPTQATVPAADASITRLKHVPLMIKMADCQAILVYDPVQHVIAAIHGGWRSLAANIIQKTFFRLQNDFGVRAQHVIAAISPSLGPCCAQFSDPRRELPDFVYPYIDSKNHVDLWRFSEAELRKAGVLSDHLELTRVCTSCTPDLYFSHRRGDAGRMAAVIMID